MTARPSIQRLANDAPVPHIESWPEQPTPTEVAAVVFVKEMAAHVDEKHGMAPTRGTQKKVADIVREKFFTPTASADSWPSHRPPSLAYNAVCTELEAQAVKSAAWIATQHRDGIVPPAEKVVLDCLRALQAIPDGERLYANELTDVIAKGFLDTASGQRTSRRRVHALLRIAGGAT